MELQPGQRVRLDQLLDPERPFVIGIQAKLPQGELDGACLGLDSDGKATDDRYVTFFNQPVTPCGGVSLAAPPGDAEGFELQLAALPPEVVRLLILVALDGESSFADVREGQARLLQGGHTLAYFPLRGVAASGEKALILLEIYRKDGIWRLAAVGQGYAGGMAAIATHYGVQVQDPAGPAPIPMPPLTLLAPDDLAVSTQDLEALETRARTIERTLEEFKVKAAVVGREAGPVVTTFALDPAPGVKVSRIRGLEADLALALSSPGLRIDPLFHHGVIGIEIPNPERQLVPLRRMLGAVPVAGSGRPLLLPIGVDARGNPQLEDLEELPHILVAGTTRSGKSVALHAFLCAVLLRTRPSEVRLLLVDPKRAEFTFYEDTPHLLASVITNPRRTIAALGWLVGEMEDRYRRMASLGLRSRAGWQSTDPAGTQGEVPPLILVVIDELADLMLQSGKVVEEPLVRLAQMGRAAGIHLVLATQRPSRDVLTGLIKANMPARLAFRVTSGMESRIILDDQGAENLLGKGDGLLLVPGRPALVRVQTPLVTESEVAAVTRFLRRTAPPAWDPSLTAVLDQLDKPVQEGWSRRRRQ